MDDIRERIASTIRDSVLRIMERRQLAAQSLIELGLPNAMVHSVAVPYILYHRQPLQHQHSRRHSLVDTVRKYALV